MLPLPVVAGLLVLLPPTLGASDAPSLEAVRDAQTVADHSAIAASSEAKAKDLREQADRHRDLVESYDAGPLYKSGGVDLAGHSELLADPYYQAAEAAERLAVGHRRLAEHAARREQPNDSYSE